MPVVGPKLSLGTCPVCLERGSKLCQGCRNISYCSPEHQKSDWKRHRNECSPILLRTNPELSRHFVAARKIEQGCIILEEFPLVFGPNVSVTCPNKYCLSCCKRILDGGTPCPKCVWPLFCSLPCAKAKAHIDNECKHFVKKKIKYSSLLPFPNHALYHGILILRTILQKPPNGRIENGFWEAIMELQHERVDKLSRSRFGFDTALVTKMRSYFKVKDLQDDEKDWRRVSGAVDVNAFSIERVENFGEEPSEVTALFPKASYFAHSCVPNCTWGIGYSPEFRIRIRVSRDLEKGEILTVAYNPNWGLYGTMKRKQMILDTGGFICNCFRCSDPTELTTLMSSIKCFFPTCNGYLLPPSSCRGNLDWNCMEKNEDHDHNASEVLVTDTVELIELELNRILSTTTITPIALLIQSINRFIEQHSMTVLHPNHWILQQASLTLANALGNQIKTLEKCERAELIRHCKYLLELANIISPGVSLNRALLQLYLSRALTVEYFNQSDYRNDLSLQRLEEISALQEEAFRYWKGDIQSKPLESSMGHEALQLNTEIIAISSEQSNIFTRMKL